MNHDEYVTPIFSVRPLQHGKSTFYRLECPDWINVIPLRRDGMVVMVRQYRFGTDEDTIEIPGGQMDPEDGSPLESAKRELLEETGYGRGTWSELGWVHPNPAILTNRCHLYLAEDVEKIGEIHNDEHEHTEVELMELKEVTDAIRNGTITHGLVINAFSRLALERPDLFKWRKTHDR